MSLRYGLLFLPYVFAVLLQGSPSASYLVAWSGSLWILYLTLAGKVEPLPEDRPLAHQLLRPVGLTQLVFAGYTAVTSIFYFLDLNGYFFLEYSAFQVASPRQFELAAEAQRYYVLAHASFSAGLLAFMDYRHSGEWGLRPNIDPTRFLVYATGGLILAAQVLRFVPGVGQIRVKIGSVAFVAAVLAFAVAIIQRRNSLITITGAFYAFNLLEAFLSGWKGQVLIMVILLCAFLYPYYKRAVSVLAPAGLIALLVILPTFMTVVRDLSWRQGVDPREAAEVAVDHTLDEETPLMRNSWQFLVGRLSEIVMFKDYLEYVPEERSYYGFSLVEQGLMGIVPRVFWSDKPNMEQLAMERVYDAGVVEEYSSVSAKPKFVVDAYLSGGALGVFLGLLLYGMIASWASRLAERWFGGYLLGSGLVYTALFMNLWRSNAFEFLFNAVLWSFVLMGVLFIGGRMIGLLVPQHRHRRKEVA